MQYYRIHSHAWSRRGSASRPAISRVLMAFRDMAMPDRARGVMEGNMTTSNNNKRAVGRREFYVRQRGSGYYRIQ
jgi:hypothetical protein